jgi:hypothetical protein
LGFDYLIELKLVVRLVSSGLERHFEQVRPELIV